MARQMPLLQSTLLLLLVLLLAGHVLAFAPFTNLLGQTESVVGIISMPYANASAMLRAFDESVKPIGAVNLSLPWTGPGYPVFVMLNHMSGLRTTPINIVIGNLDYFEFIIGIPQIITASGRTGATLTKLYLSSAEATLGGNVFFGLPKEVAGVSMDLDAGTFKVADGWSRNTLVEASFTPYHHKQPQAFNEFSPLQQVWQAMLGQTVVQPILFPIYDNSVHLCSNMVFDWTSPSTQYWTTNLTISFPTPFLPGLPLGPFKVAPVSASNPFGAFALRTTWNLSPPYNKCN